jgi:hypothetical protein
MFYDWSKDNIEEYLTKNSESRILYIEYQYQQLGKDEEWFRKICQLLLNDVKKIKREVFLQRIRGSSQSPYDADDLQAINELKGKIREQITINQHFILDVYEPLKKDIPYIVGVDPADGGGKGDNAALTIMNPYTLKPVAEFKSPFISITQFNNLLITLVRNYIPRAILCVEKNKGEGIISALMESTIANNLYYDTSKEFIQIDDRLDPQGFLRREAEKRRIRGVWTGEKSRAIMFGLLDAHIKEHKDKFVTANIINDLFGLICNKHGKIVAGPGFHDDSVMSYLIALYVYYHGKNLHRFGIVKGYIPGEEERNKGLVFEDVIHELPEEQRQHFANTVTKDQKDFDELLREEIRRHSMQSRRENQMIQTVNNVQSYDDDGSYEQGNIDLSIFDELNK